MENKSNMPSPTHKKVRKYSWKEIKRAIVSVYDKYHHVDDWNVEVVYRESMMQHMKEELIKPLKRK